MNEKQIIDEVVRELYKRLTTKVVKPCAYVIGPVELPFVEELKEHYDVITKRNEVLEMDFIVITNLTVSMLAHIAQGCCQTSSEEEVLEALLEGKPVYVLEEGIVYRNYRQSAHKALYAMFLEFEEKIERFGIQKVKSVLEILTRKDSAPSKGILKEMEDAKEVRYRNEVQYKNEVQYSNEVQYTKEVQFGKRLVLEKDLKELGVNCTIALRIPKNCIITPMAQDYIREHQIKIVRM